MSDSCTSILGSKTKSRYHSPLEKKYHPELDTENFLDSYGIQRCQSLISELQFSIYLRIIDIATAIMTVLFFRIEPRVAHMDRIESM